MNVQALLTALSKHEGAFTALESIFTMAAIVLAGIWTWLLFVKNREKYPKAELKHSIRAWELSPGSRLLRVSIQLTNTSRVLLELGSGFCWVQQLKPCPSELLESLAAKQSLVREGETEVRWPLLDERPISFEGQKEIEPSESDEIIADFVIESGVEEVLVYSFLENRSKPGRNIGWAISTSFDLHGDSGTSKTKISTEQSSKKPKPTKKQPSIN